MDDPPEILVATASTRRRRIIPGRRRTCRVESRARSATAWDLMGCRTRMDAGFVRLLEKSH
jgi:hypothetical protein